MSRYSRAFFELQWRFAERVAAISSSPLEVALLHYTNFYIRFGLGRQFDANHSVWRIYIDGLTDAADPVEWTWRFFLTREEMPPPALVARFGCFSYAIASDTAIRLHFSNIDSPAYSPLSRKRIDARRAELRALFEHVMHANPSTQRVLGTSWLYNLPAYRRLFPLAYIETARELTTRFQNMPLWGQFLDRYGNVRPDMQTYFLQRIAQHRDMAAIAQCFPFRALATDVSIAVFDGFYDAS
ncbi:hypothetical protein [Paraburkholderia sp. C35]|uniref:hypothetical protein n=1 Tax=Paraburkholderia sp. C35 TaxID=2126993 RepID=UPI000D699379|nr:hypothetical protein [Paraburkholderia sp. C35]